jgi:hypothetical protein
MSFTLSTSDSLLVPSRLKCVGGEWTLQADRAKVTDPSKELETILKEG